MSVPHLTAAEFIDRIKKTYPPDEAQKYLQNIIDLSMYAVYLAIQDALTEEQCMLIEHMSDDTAREKYIAEAFATTYGISPTEFARQAQEVAIAQAQQSQKEHTT